MKLIHRVLHKVFGHWWAEIRVRGPHLYEECKYCKKRRITNYHPNRYAPLSEAGRMWLGDGEYIKTYYD